MLRICFFISCLSLVAKVSAGQDDPEISRLKSLPGHMKPFGSEGPFFHVPIVEGFPTTYDFFNNYVIPSIPVVMKGAAKISPAFKKWTDEYFIKHKDASEKVYAEARKKEDRTIPGSFLSFRTFVKQYIKHDIYMVNGVPMFLRRDVLLPPPLNCEKVKKNLADTVMWFSSGGTKSVLHNDDVDNINCLYRGNKTLTFVSPFQTDEDWVASVIDHPEGTYSDIDVDAVDYVKYRKLSDINYGVVQMKEGDCLFIPYKWAHQVNSYGNNLAVNIWFNHLPNNFRNLTPADCGDQSVDATLDRVKFETTDQYSGSTPQQKPIFDKDYSPDKKEHEAKTESTEEIKEEEKEEGEEGGEEETPLIAAVFQAFGQKSSIDIEDLKAGILMMQPSTFQSWDDACENTLNTIYSNMDLNGDNQLNVADHDLFKHKHQEEQYEIMQDVDDYYQALAQALYNAQLVAERVMIRKLIQNGQVEMDMAKNIYGEKFVADIKPVAAAKEEL
uniref:Uncharacterized protein LOC100182837 n=1 Tax=Phallusia mammillata TaxID=59560 RepID=A0A6F9DIA1_9ASCI|nr:uncharacterized protein LOC100182837 [Phallusia mammillata]